MWLFILNLAVYSTEGNLKQGFKKLFKAEKTCLTSSAQYENDKL